MNEVILPISKFTGKLFIGSLSSLNYASMNDIKYIVSLCPIHESKIRTDIDHDVFNINDDTYEVSVKKMEEILKITRKKITTHLMNGDNVLVHCFAGISRSATVVLDFLLYSLFTNLECGREDGKSVVKEAIKYLRRYRNIINPNSGFIRLLNRLYVS